MKKASIHESNNDSSSQTTSYKPFQIIQTPSVITRICQFSKQDYINRCKSQNFEFEDLLRLRRGPRIKKIGQNRQTYRNIKQNLTEKLQNFNSKLLNLQLGEVLVWKQQILTGFLTDFMVQIGKECRQKADILLFIWNSVFNIIEYLVQIVGKMNLKDQKQYLNNLIENHKDYQKVIENMKQKIAKKQHNYMHQQQFIKSLVYNLRYKRKQISKLSKNLKLCTQKINEIKDCYIDLQIQHVQLLSQNRQISKQNALHLLKRKQELNHEKRIEYKMKQSHKKIKLQIENQIENEDINEYQNVQKLNNQLKTTFNNFQQKKKQQSRLSKQYLTPNYSPKDDDVQLIFENAIDDFNVRIDSVPQTHSIIDFKNTIAFVDIGTDMDGFKVDAEDVTTQITQYDKLYEDMISHKASQTKQKVTLDQEVQTSIAELKNQSMGRFKVLERSYLFEDYRDKKYKRQMLQKNALKFHNNELTSLQELKQTSNKFKVTRKKTGFDSSVDFCSIMTQTDPQNIFQVGNIPKSYRDMNFQKLIAKYFVKLNRIQNQNNQSQKSSVKSSIKSSVKNKSIISKIINFGSSKTIFSGQSQSKVRQQSLGYFTIERESMVRSAMSSSARMSASTHHTSLYHTDAKEKKGILKRRVQNPFGAIEQNKYENMISRQIQRSQRKKSLAKSAQKTRKFWVMKPMTGEKNSKGKQRFLDDLNRGEKLLSKRSLNRKADGVQQNKKILNQLQKLSEQIESNQLNYDVIQSSLEDNIAILAEQLKKMLNKKRNNRKLPQSRLQSLCKTISFVYTYAYHLFFNHSKSFYSLLIPLFNYFKIGYGQIKKNDLYLRMLYFLSQTIYHQEQNFIFSSFITLLGLNLDKNQKIQSGKQNTTLYLKILHRLSINFKFPVDIESLYTNVDHFKQKCHEILLQEDFEPGIVQHIMSRIKISIKQLVGRQDTDEIQQNAEIKETQLNVFKCTQLLILEIQRVKSNIEDSYSHLLTHFEIFQGQQYPTFFTYLLKNNHIPNLQLEKSTNIIKRQIIRLDKITNPQQKMNELVKILMLARIPDFSKLYYNAIHKYKIKEQFLYLAINRRLKLIIAYLEHWSQQFYIEKKLINVIIKKAQEQKSSLFKQITIRKIMALTYLRVVEHQTTLMHEQLMGQPLKDLYYLSNPSIQQKEQQKPKTERMLAWI